ncbi:MAG: hypothetical protein MUC37_01200 [Hyphomicrobium sp.]|jgi:YbbR domain-containing protein|nr:hypothetical protein [Hyphomicrobium sp.]
MKYGRALFIAIQAALVIAASPAAHSEDVIRIENRDTGRLTGEIIAVSQEQRTVDVVGPRGNVLHLKLGEAAVNFDKLRVGQAVGADYVIDELILVVPASVEVPTAAEAVAVGRAAKGQMPAAFIEDAFEITTKITAIDYQSRTVTLEFPNGKAVTIKVKPDVPLQNAKVGEKVVYVSRTGLKLQLE